MRNFWNSSLDEHLKVFSRLISLVELTTEQKHRILKAFISLVEPNEEISIKMLRNSLNAIWTYVQKHYDEGDSLYKTLLTIAVNEQLIRNTLDGTKSYENLIEKLSFHADQKTYNVCADMIAECKNNREKSYFAFVFRSILLKYDNDYWTEWIESNISNNWISEIYTYIDSGIIIFNGIRQPNPQLAKKQRLW